MKANKQTAIGAFVLGGLILALCAIVFFGNASLFSSKEHAIIVFTEPVTGLSVGAPVTFRGLQVGTVDSVSIQLDPTQHSAYIPVRITLDPQKIEFKSGSGDEDFEQALQRMIDNGLRAKLDVQSFVTGSSNIFLNFDKKSIATFHPQLAGHTIEIPTQTSDIQKIKSELMNLELKKLSTDADAVILKITTLTDQLNTSLPPLVQSFRTTSDSAAKLLSDLDKQLNSTITNFNRLLNNSNQQVAGRGKELKALLLTTNKTMVQISTLVKNLNSMSSVRSPMRNNLESLSRDLADTAASLRGFSNEIERNPKLLLIGRRQ